MPREPFQLLSRGAVPYPSAVQHSGSVPPPSNAILQAGHSGGKNWGEDTIVSRHYQERFSLFFEKAGLSNRSAPFPTAFPPTHTLSHRVSSPARFVLECFGAIYYDMVAL
jgi:hypothetical protein